MARDDRDTGHLAVPHAAAARRRDIGERVERTHCRSDDRFAALARRALEHHVDEPRDECFTHAHGRSANRLHIAATSGVNVGRERTVLLLVAALVTGAAVAVSGIISFVGLVVPHALRLIVGASHARLLPLSALGGALFLVAADTVARTAFGTVVVQTGVVAALVGAPVFLAMILRRQRS